MIEQVKKTLTGQFEASLCMMNACIAKCPPDHWNGKIAKYAFWHVAHHTLCFVDLYLSIDEESFQFRKFHPQGWSDFNEEFPSRAFDQAEIAEYLQICRQKAIDTFAADTPESLERPSGFKRLAFSRLELHLYNLRHLQHHTGQLGASLRRIDESIDPFWVGSGWK